MCSQRPLKPTITVSGPISGEGQAMAALLWRLRLTEDMDRFNKG